MSGKKTLGLFEGVGIELEYMIVNRDTLDVLPVADELIKSVAGAYSNEYEKENICWSNELALHVVELKTCGPVATLFRDRAALPCRYQANKRNSE